MSTDSTYYAGVQPESSVVLWSVPINDRILEAPPKSRGGRRHPALPALPRERGFREAVESSARSQTREPSSEEGARNTMLLRGRLRIAGLPHYPEQQWVVSFFGSSAIFENQPDKSWPKVQIEFASVQPIAELGVD